MTHSKVSEDSSEERVESYFFPFTVKKIRTYGTSLKRVSEIKSENGGRDDYPLTVITTEREDGVV